ncbi:hypothetical protein HLH36_16730 [Gluconacetobacter aggeris]|uniref:Uncharacterized protein n=1 Tax=Gluconacetobacter aggeris TaxID=1286186 RepID=A0A7W4IVS4_9PROT|nr:hypothetical protein [Gluconacetobacter aggeris]MBB2169970.1 hypothetical protein [Gluconacetobacter aggeris]
MPAATLGPEGALKTLRESKGSTSLQLWMELNYEVIRTEWGSRRMNWGALCQWFEEQGLTNSNGEIANIRCAKMIWFRVGKRLEQERKTEANVTSMEMDQCVRDAST